MNPSKLFILRPVATSLLMIAFVLAGLVSFQYLPVSALPDVDYPTIQVQTFYPGASPDVMASSVTAPLERQLGEMEGLGQMQSSSSAGASVITLQFDLSLSLDVAEQEVQAAINAAGNLLPSDLPAPPIYAKVNPADAPVMTLAITSKTMNLTDVESIANTRLASKLSEIPGVGLVTISGGNTPAVRVEVNPQALASYGLSIDNIRTDIGNLNVNSPKGSFSGPTQTYTIDDNDQITQADEYAKLVVAYKNGTPVYLGDVARIISAPENAELGAWANRTPAIVLQIQRQPGANVIATVNEIKRALPTFTAGLPAAMKVAVMSDGTISIRASVSDAELDLSLSVALVVLVIFLFLRNIRATIIPSITVPVSLIGALSFMYLFGFSIDNLSLMALIVATGFVVDDSIVMIENISRYVEMGESPMNAALKGAGQMGFTIISLTASLIAVLIPLLFMGDVVGRLFSEFAITLACTIVISAVVSLTLVPMLCSRLLLDKKETHYNRFELWTEAQFNRVIAAYGRGLTWVLAHVRLTLGVAVAALVLTVLLYVFIPKGFFPVQDTGVIQGVSQGAQSTSYAAMAQHQQALADAILKDKDVVSLTSSIGVDGTNTTLNQGSFLINLKPKDERSLSAAQIIPRLDREVAGVPGIALFLQPVQSLTLNTTVSPTQYQFVLEDPNADDFTTYVPQLMAKLQALPQLTDVASGLEASGLAVYINIDRTNAARFGITPATVDSALYDAFGQRIISTIFTETDQYRVILGTDAAQMNSVAALGRIYLPSSSATGGQVPLSAIASFTVQQKPLVIEHLGQFPATTISFNLASGYSLGQAVDAINAAEAALKLPAAIQTNYLGAAASFQSSLGNEVFLLLAAIITVYIVLGVLYESFIHPVTILSTLPSAAIGALFFLWISGEGLGVIGIIGIVLLIGIVKKNAIMMIDFALAAERLEGKTSREAIHEAALLRFRPILMTTLAAMFSGLPLIFGGGMGSELRQPLGIAIVGGLLVSQVLTLFTTPAIYLAFDSLSQRLRPQIAADITMNISALFIRRPVATILLTLGIALSGILGFVKMPVAPLPSIAFPTIQVQATMAGASPDTMASTVAEPLERHLGSIADVTEMTSQSGVGTTRITLQFGLDRDINGAARDVEAAIQAARADLPTSLRSNPSYNKFNPADAPIMVLALTSDTLTPAQLYDSADSVLEQQFSQISGVGDVELGGAALPAVRVELEPGPLATYGIGLEDVRAAIAAANANAPKGYFNAASGVRYQLYTNDQATLASQYRGLVIAYRNNQAVRLSDVAQVSDSVENLQNAGYYNGKAAVLVIIHPSPDANIIQTVDAIKALLPQLRAALPPAVSIGIAMDRSQSIRAALGDTERTLFIAVLLVVGVVYVFLRSPRATLIPGLAVPVSILGTFGPMYLLGFSIDNLSLMALTIAVGFVVDDAVVVTENTMRHLEAGMEPREAALRGGAEVSFTVLSMSASLIAVFLPILLMPGLLGRLFQEFAETLSIAILISLLVSLTTTPMLCGLLLRAGESHGQSRFRIVNWLESGFESARGFYERSLRWALNHARLVGVSLIVTIILNIVLFIIVPKGFFPEQDTGLVIGNITADQSISFDAMKEKLSQLQTIIQDDPGVESVAGFTGGHSTNTGMLFITLKPLGQRHISATAIVARLRRPLGQIAGAQTFLVPAQDLRVGGRQSNAEYQYTLKSDDAQDLYTWAPKIVTALQADKSLVDVNSDMQQGGLETDIKIDRAQAARYGITPEQIDQTLYDAFGQRTVSTIYNELNQYEVVMEFAPEYQQTPGDLARIYVSTSGGTASGTSSTQLTTGSVTSTSTTAASATSAIALDSATNAAVNSIAASGHSSGSSGAAVSTNQEVMVPLAAFASIAPGTTPISVNHDGGRVAATISFSLPQGVALSVAAAAIQKTMAQLDVPLTITGSFAGTAAAFQSSSSSEPLLILAALVTVYIVLGILYESTIHPLTIISTIPSAGLGATLFLLVLNVPLTIIALIGIILLIGIVKKNAILMIDFALQLERGENLSPEEAIFRAASLRFRPILMTSFAAILGAVPLAVGLGQGASLRQPLGLTIIGGLAVSQALTLYTTPVVYLWLDRLGAKLRGGQDKAAPRAGSIVEAL